MGVSPGGEAPCFYSMFLAQSIGFARVLAAAGDFLKHALKKKDAMGMKLMKYVWLRGSTVFAASQMQGPFGGLRAGFRLQALWRPALRTIALGAAVLLLAGAEVAGAQAVSTTTVQGTVYLANGQPGSGTLA